MLLRCWAAGLMKGPGRWSRGISSLLGFGLLPVSLIPPPVVCFACFCPIGPFQKMPPEYENTKHWVNSLFTLSCQNYQFILIYIILGEHITYPETIQHTVYRGPRWTDWSQTEKLWNTDVAAGLNFVSTYLPPPTTYTHKSSTMLNDMQLQLSTTHRH